MSQTYVIETGIPVPAAARSTGRRPGGLSEALRRMQPGQSMLVTGRKQSNVGSQANQQARLIADGRKYVTRTVEGGVRVWRTA